MSTNWLHRINSSFILNHYKSVIATLYILQILFPVQESTVIKTDTIYDKRIAFITKKCRILVIFCHNTDVGLFCVFFGDADPKLALFWEYALENK